MARLRYTDSDKDNKKQPAGKKSPVFTVLLLVCLCVFLYSGWRLFNIFWGYLQGRLQYSQTADQYVADTPGSDASAEQAADDPAGAEEDPLFPDKAPITVDWEALQAQNPDVVGWIYCKDTVVNYPVLQARDNDKYLHTMIDGRYNDAGSIFMDCLCDPQLADLATILYGHHMKDGSMFAMLHNYTRQEYYEEHPCMWYLTPEADYRLDLYAGYLDAPDADIYTVYTEKEQLDAYMEYASGRSNFQPLKEFGETDHVFVLSTCAYEFEDARYLVAAVPVRVR